jgi:hypothetical protein
MNHELRIINKLGADTPNVGGIDIGRKSYTRSSDRGISADGEADHKYRTVIEVNPAPGTPAIGADSTNTATTVYSLVVLGKDETASGTARASP